MLLWNDLLRHDRCSLSLTTALLLTTVLAICPPLFAIDNWPPPNLDAYPWEPQPEKAALMVLHAHPDDEAIFFGGAIPYYTQVRNLPTVTISLTNGDGGLNHLTPEGHLVGGPLVTNHLGQMVNGSGLRVQELREAVWNYGMRNEPIIAPFLADTFPDPTNVATLAPVVDYLVEQIRTYRPEVIITHDFHGEYGHKDHQASATAMAAAFNAAADPSYRPDLGVIWQTKKLYVHLWNENQMKHDWEGEVPGANGLSSRDIANIGLAAHRSQSPSYWSWETDLGGSDGKPGSPVLAGGGVRWDGEGHAWSSNDWGLFDWAPGYNIVVDNDFFAGTWDPFGELGDVNLDGVVSGDGTGHWETDDVAALIRGWGTSGHATLEEQWRHGDLNFDGRTNLQDWHLLRTNHPGSGNFDLASLLAGRTVPEPQTIAIVLLGALLFSIGKWSSSAAG